MRTLTNPTTTVEGLRHLRFSSYQKYFYFVNDSSHENKEKMITAGLLVEEPEAPSQARCLTFDEFKSNHLSSNVPSTF